MLIIAIPKSASTSLLYTLGKEINFPCEQIFGNSSKSGAFNLLSKLHSDIGNYDSEFFRKMNHPYKIFKQHIPPTDNNLKHLSSIKKVVLLRQPEEVVLAYKRGAKAGVHNLIDGFDPKWDDNTWLSISKESGLYDDLLLFHDTWLKQKSENTLIIFYEDLMNEPTKVVNQILKFYEIPILKREIDLVKARYSRVSFFRKILRKIKKKYYA